MDERIREFLKTSCGITDIPCYSWFTQLLGIIKPASFNECFMKWALTLVDTSKSGTISLGGKTVCSTGNMKTYKKAVAYCKCTFSRAWHYSWAASHRRQKQRNSYCARVDKVVGHRGLPSGG